MAAPYFQAKPFHVAAQANPAANRIANHAPAETAIVVAAATIVAVVADAIVTATTRSASAVRLVWIQPRLFFLR